MATSRTIVKQSIFCLALIASGYLLVELAPAVDVQLYERGLSPILHLQTNAYHLWRVYGLGTSTAPIAFALFLLGFFLYAQSRSDKLLSPAASTLLIAVLLPAMLQKDTVIFTAICTLPWILLTRTEQMERRGYSSLEYLLCGSALALTANQLALPLALFLLFYLQERDPKLSCILLSPPLCAGLLIPAPYLPDYPHYAKVIADDGLAGHIKPLATIDSLIPFVEHIALQSQARPVFLLLGALGIFITLLSRAQVPYLLRYGLPLFIILAWDLYLPEQYRVIGPLAAALRVFPGLYFFTLVPMTLALLTMVIADECVHLRQRISVPLSLVLAFACYGMNSMLSLTALSAAQTYKTAEQQGSRKKLISPSYAVYKRTLPHEGQIQKIRYRSSKRFHKEYVDTGNSTEKRFHKLEDKNTHTRWSLRKGRQDGDEKVAVRFTTAIILDGVKLDTGDFSSDFPRGIRLRGSRNCSERRKDELLNPNNYITLFESKEWLGPIEYTRDGYPYYGNQHIVQIALPKAEKVECLLIEQLGKAPFDWSIAELSFSGIFPDEVIKKRKEKLSVDSSL